MKNRLILENRVYRNNKYCLEETLNNISDHQILNESVSMELIQLVYRLLTELSLSAGDEISFQAAGLALLPGRIALNLTQLWWTNKGARKVIEKYENRTDLSESEINELKKIRSKLGRDIADIFSSIFSAVPIPILDNIIQIAIETAPSLASENLITLIDNFSNINPEINSMVNKTPLPDSAQYFNKISKIILDNDASNSFLSEIANLYVDDLELDSESEFNESDIDEAITMASGNIAGRIAPIGRENHGSIYDQKKKALQEQRERIAILQSYHQKTTNRLK